MNTRWDTIITSNEGIFVPLKDANKAIVIVTFVSFMLGFGTAHLFTWLINLTK